MTSKAQRRARKRRITLPGGQSVAQKASGLDRTHTNQRETPEDARRTAMEARKRVYGGRDSQEAERASSSPLCGSDVGRCILKLRPTDHAAVWDTWQSLCAAVRNYRTRIIGKTGDPQGAAIAMVPDAMQADQSLTVDLRTAEERDEAAKRAHSYWMGLLNGLPINQRWAVREAFLEFSLAPMWKDGEPTPIGAQAVAGLVAIGAAHARA